jgi:hypothetical protein
MYEGYMVILPELTHVVFMDKIVDWWIGCCDGVRLPSQNCGLGLLLYPQVIAMWTLVDDIG